MMKLMKWFCVFAVLIAAGLPHLTDACNVRLSALCGCEAYLAGLQLNCTSSNFSDVLEALRDYRSPIFKLIVSNSSIPVLRHEHFKGLSMQHLEFNRNGMKEIAPDAFRDQAESLESLVVSQNLLKEIPVLDYLSRLTRLDLIDNLIQSIPEGIFAGNKRIQELRLRGNAICSMSIRALEEVKGSFELVDLSRNCFRSFPSMNFRGAPKLAYFDLSSNEIRDLPDLSFMNNPALIEARLSGNSIGGVRPLSFMNVPKLAYLYLNDNEINFLEPERFKNLQGLKFLDLSGNKIKRLPQSAFKELPLLDQIDLSDNLIETVDSLAFRTNPSLRAIGLQNNGLQLLSRNAFEDLPKMIQLDLSNNSLEAIGPEQLSGMAELQHVNLRSNKITVIESKSFLSVPHLTTLDLGENGIRNIPSDGFEGLEKLYWLDLCCNGIETFVEGTFTKKITNIILHDNDLQCDEKLDWFIEYLVKYGVKTFLPNEEEVACSGPPEHEGTKLRDLMIKKANDTFFNRVNEILPGGGSNELPLFGNILPGLGDLPSVKNGGGIPAITKGLESINTLTRFVPAFNQVPGLSALTDPGTYLPSDRSSDLEPLIQELTDPITNFATSGQIRAGEVNKLVRSIPKLAQQLPRPEGAPPAFDMSKLSPELVKEVMKGNPIPGVSSQVLEGFKQQYLEQMADAAVAALRGETKTSSGAPVSSLLFPLTDLPANMVQSVLRGDALPGLSPEKTNAIKTYYMNQAMGGDKVTGVKGGRAGRVQGGLLPAELLRQLAKEIDLADLPSELLQKIANGERIALDMVPKAVVEQLETNNPELASRLAKALLSPSETTKKPSLDAQNPDDRAPLVRKGPVYDLGSVSNDISNPLASEDNTNIPLYTGIGLACVGAITLATVGYLCYKRSQVEEDLAKAAFTPMTPKSMNLGNNNSMYIPPPPPLPKPSPLAPPSGDFHTFRSHSSLYYQGEG